MRPARRLICSVLIGLSAFAQPLVGQSPPAGPTTKGLGGIGYEIAEFKNVMVTMRDGVRLATDIYVPTRSGATTAETFPAILSRTPYNKDVNVSTSFAKTFVQHGYVVVAQDVRGRFQSEGHWRPLRDDPNDGFDTAKWIGAQPWSNQSIGTVGTSYGGATQHALAIAGAPYVKAMIPRNAMSDFGLYGVRHH